MNFNDHSKIKDCHAFLSASKYHWIRYTDDKLIDSYRSNQAVLMGTKLHNFASDCINLGQKLPRSKKTLNAFVNDAIGFGMSSEVVLFYSENCFGTADAISFDPNTKLLRIHDLKTGVTPAKFEQLMIYAAMFCLEYRHDPNHIEIELRIYQSDEVLILEPDPMDIDKIIEIIERFDKLLKEEKGRI